MPGRLSHTPLDASSLVRPAPYLHHPQWNSCSTQPPTTTSQLCFPTLSSTSTPPFMSPPMSPPINHFRFPPQSASQSVTQGRVPAFSAQQPEPKAITSRLASHSPATAAQQKQQSATDPSPAAAASQMTFFSGFTSGHKATSDTR